MWIIPKNLDCFPYAVDMLELNSELSELSRICEQSLMWRSKHSLVRTWSQRWKKVSWMQHLSGRILKPSMDGLFVETYILSLPVIPAKGNPVLAKEKGKQTPDGFGRILKESLRQLNLFGSLEKTSADTLPLDSPQFIEAYEIWVTQLRQDCLRRQSAVRPTDENGYLSWRSPAEQPAAIKIDKLTGELGKRMYHKETGRLAQYGLDQQVNLLADYKKPRKVPTAYGDKMRWETSQEYWKRIEETEKNWATPNTMDMLPPKTKKGLKREAEITRPNRTQPANLRDQVSNQTNWPTPQQRDCTRQTSVKRDRLPDRVGLLDQDSLSTNGKSRGLWGTPKASRDGTSKETLKMVEKGTAENSLDRQIAKQGKLNPDWVEQLMGLIVGWTDCDF